LKKDLVVPIEEQEYYSLTHKQLGKGMMFLLREKCLDKNYNKEIGSFNIYRERNFDYINYSTLKDAFNILLSRHEALRTKFISINGEVKQKVMPIELLSSSVVSYDFSGLEDAESAAKLIKKKLIETNFDFFEDLPIQIGLIKIRNDQYIIILIVNHVASDFYSLVLLENELKEIYGSLERDGSPTMIDNAIQIKDYAAWENAKVRGSDNQFSLFWEKKLASKPPINLLKSHKKIILPTINNDDSYANSMKREMEDKFWHIEGSEIDSVLGVVHRASTLPGASYRFTIDGKVYSDLKMTSIQTRTTTFTVLISSFLLLLNKLSGENDVIVGIETVIRNEELKNVVGWLSNTMFYRKELDSNIRIDEFINEIGNEILEHYEYRCYPIEKILLDRDISLDAIGALYLNYVNHLDEKDIKARESEKIHHQGGLPYFDLDWFLDEYTNGIEINLRYRRDLFEQAQIESVVQLFFEVLEFMLRHQKKLLRDLENSLSDTQVNC